MDTKALRLAFLFAAVLGGSAGCGQRGDAPGARPGGTGAGGHLPPASPDLPAPRPAPPPPAPAAPAPAAAGTPAAPPDLPIDDAAEPDRALNWREIPLAPATGPDALTFSADGKLVAAAGPEFIHVVAADTGAPVTRMRLPERQNGLAPRAYSMPFRMAFSPDGKTLASATDGDGVLRFWDTKTGKQVREFALPQPKERGAIGGPFVDVAPGAGRVAVRGYGPPYGHFDILDATDGSLVRSLDAKSTNGRFSPDGKVFAAYHDGGAIVGAWEVDTGKKLLWVEAWNMGDVGKHLLFPDPTENAGGMKFGGFLSSDNRLVVTDAFPRDLRHGENEFLFVWRLGAGAEAPAARVPAPGAVWMTAVVPGPGARALVVCTSTRFGVYDLLREEYRPEFKGPAEKCTHVALCPDGVTLAAIAPSIGKRGDGGTQSVYLARFPRLGPAVPPGREWTAADVDFLWAGVASRNEFRRAYCTRALLDRPERAAEIARERLRPVPRAETDRVEGLIQKLSDDSPDVRDKATADLRDVVYTFGPLLRACHGEAPAGEVRNRLGIVLDPRKRPAPPAGLEAALRQIGFLERLGTPPARRLLAEIARGAPGARLTDEAAAAVKRLAGE